MKVQRFSVNPFSENTYVCHDGVEAVLIDPGCSNATERAAVLAYVERMGLHLRVLLLTHAHVDHVLGCAYFAERFGLDLWMHAEDVPLLEAAPRQAKLYGLEMEVPPAPARLLRGGDSVVFGSSYWEVLHCPGHSPGSVCFHDPAAGLVIAGDVLFQGSIGRTDLWKGSMPQLLQSIRDRLLPLDDSTIVYAGHGEPTTIGHERVLNPFLV